MSKKIFFTALFCAVISVSVLFADTPSYNFKANKAVKDNKQKTFSNIEVQQQVLNMETGWNLGNTLDANGGVGLKSEVSWQMPYTTKEMIDGLAASGIKTIRIPVSWANHIIDDRYTIDPNWMKRVKQIVDWAIEDDLFVILNTHHDNFPRAETIPHCSGYYPSPVNSNESILFIKNVWAQISLAFNNGYDEHLVFEILNEPRLRGHGHEWDYNNTCNDCKYAVKQINKLNQVGVDAIRASGGNNQKRFIMVSGIAAAFSSYFKDDSFVFPKDFTNDEISNQRFILSVHLYAPYEFAMKNPGVRELTKSHLGELSYYFEALNEKFVEKGYPVVIGEYGATNKDNLDSRIEWFKFFITESRKYGMTACLWDNGQIDTENTYEEKFGFYNRTEQKWYFPEIQETIVEAVKQEY